MPSTELAEGPQRGSRLLPALIVVGGLGLTLAAVLTMMLAKRRDAAQSVVMLYQRALATTVAIDGAPDQPVTDNKIASRVALKHRGLRLDARFLRDGEIVDYWGRPLRVLVDKERVEVVSAGADGAFGTGDDIGSRQAW